MPLNVLTSFGHPSLDPSSYDQRPIFVSDIFAHTELLAAPVFDSAGPNENERTRPNLKVQDGCDNRCSFCVIPYVRGQSRSLEPDEIIREVNALVDSGYREVVISGINLGRWGRDLEDRRRALGVRHPALADAQGPTPDASSTDFESLVFALFSPRPRSRWKTPHLFGRTHGLV